MRARSGQVCGQRLEHNIKIVLVTTPLGRIHCGTPNLAPGVAVMVIVPSPIKLFFFGKIMNSQNLAGKSEHLRVIFITNIDLLDNFRLACRQL